MSIERLFHLLKVEMKRLEVRDVPLHELSTELACVLNMPQCFGSWPLLSDPYHLGLFLVKRICPNIQIFDHTVRNILSFVYFLICKTNNQSISLLSIILQTSEGHYKGERELNDNQSLKYVRPFVGYIFHTLCIFLLELRRKVRDGCTRRRGCGAFGQLRPGQYFREIEVYFTSLQQIRSIDSYFQTTGE